MTVASVAYRNRGGCKDAVAPALASTVACPKCGCRMVTKVGRRTEGRFVCSNCGRPIDGLRLAREQTRRWQAALAVTLLALGGTLLFLLGSANEILQGGAAGEEKVVPGAEPAGAVSEGGGRSGE